MKSLLNFIKYNNAFPIILVVVILGTGAAFAMGPDLRQSALDRIGKTSLPSATPATTDTTKLLAENIDNFDLRLRIDTITEDEESYHVTYSYRTFEVAESAWKEVRKKGKMDIPKALLGKRDLKSYLAEQIGQVIDREIAYLGEAKAAIRTKAAPEKSAKYAALSGSEIGAAPRTSAESSVAPEESVSGESKPKHAETGETTAPGITLTKEEINDMIVQAVSDFLAIDLTLPPPPEVSSAEAPASIVENTSEATMPVAPESFPDSVSETGL